MDLSQYKDLFLKEGRDIIEKASKAVMDMEDNPEDGDCVNELFRCFHSIKGMAASMGYEDISKYSHVLEDVLDEMKDGKIGFNKDVSAVLSEGTDSLGDMFDAVEEDRSFEVDINQLNERIGGLKKSGRKAEKVSERKAGRAEEWEIKGSNTPQDGEKRELKVPAMLKVESKVIDQLIGLLGELITSKNRLTEATDGESSYIFKEELHAMSGVLKRLDKALLHMRLIPFGEVTHGLKKLIKKYSKGKDIEFVVEGEDVEVDRIVLERLLEPLVHVIKNAIDHGIEKKEDRRLAGKNERGFVKVSLLKRHGEVIIEIEDDGSGMDAEKIKKKAVALNLITSEDADAMSDSDVFLLTCYPGFSLAESVTEISGRGVGMDVVFNVMRELGGRLEIESEHKKGTKLKCFLPAVTMIAKVLLVSFAGEVFALPLAKVKKIISGEELVNGDISPIESGAMDMPLVDLNGLLGKSAAKEGKFESLIIFDMGDRTCAVTAEEVIGVRDAYIRDLPQPLDRIQGLSGYTFVKGERPVFILDLQALGRKKGVLTRMSLNN